MKKEGKHGPAIRIFSARLLGAGATFHDRPYGLQMAGIRSEAQVYALSGASGAIDAVAPMVLDVPIALHGIGDEVPFEIREDRRVGQAEDVRHHIETAAVRHPNHDLLDSERGSKLHESVQRRDQRFATFQRVALLPQISAVEKTLEDLRIGQTLENSSLELHTETRSVPTWLHLQLQPAASLRVLHVKILHADRAAVSLLQYADDLAQSGALRSTCQMAGIENSVEIFVRKSKTVEFEIRMSPRNVLQRMGTRNGVSHIAVSENQTGDLRLQLGLSGGNTFAGTRCQLESLEEHTPVRTQTRRVLFPGLVE